MKRILEESPVKGYQLFRYAKQSANGSAVILPNYYIRHNSKDTCTKTDGLKDAKTAVKKMAAVDRGTLSHKMNSEDPSADRVSTL